jgi:hypothetical protein
LAYKARQGRNAMTENLRELADDDLVHAWADATRDEAPERIDLAQTGPVPEEDVSLVRIRDVYKEVLRRYEEEHPEPLPA